MRDESREGFPLVSVWMVTYNHENYIRQCLESVIVQNTDFKFEVIIGEDCSTDGTRAIVKEFEDKYPNIIKPVYHAINVGASRNAYEFCYPKLTGKYIACMEGDDYWSDPHKLQKQVDFLEKNIKYSICWTKYKVLNETKVTIPTLQKELFEPGSNLNGENKDIINIDLNNIFNPYVTHTLTAMFRRSALNYSALSALKYAKDNTIFCMCLSNGKGAILNFFSGIYRIHSGGTYTGLNLFNQRYSSFLNMEEIVKFIAGCNTSNLIFTRNNLLIEAYSLVTFAAFNGSGTIILKLYTKIIEYAPLKEKLKATKNLFVSLLHNH